MKEGCEGELRRGVGGGCLVVWGVVWVSGLAGGLGRLAT